MFGLGCAELLILVGVAFGLVVLFRKGRITDKPLFVIGLLVFLGVSIIAWLGSMRPAPGNRAFAALVVTGNAVMALLIWAAKLWLWPHIRALRFSTCPPVEKLTALLAERLPSSEQARFAAHLDVCTVCQQRVEWITAGQQSWPGMARKLSEHPPSPEPALRKVIERLKESNEEATRDEPVFSADLPLGFLSPTDKPGQLGRLERYDVLEEIGRGGMGVVLKAFDPTLHRVVAIKVLAPQLATSGVARKRFLREAKAAAAVTHDHIVTIHAVDEANGLPYLVMQYIAGLSLQERIDKEGPLELSEVLRIGMQTASGLAAAHAQGIVHRDIKPANILLEEGMQRVKITDFGLARAMDDASLTQSGFVAGSPLYMAPEQARGEGLDHRADLFSLGSVVYTMCTGRPPFRAHNTLAVLRRVSEESPRPIRETNPEIPDWLAAVVEKLMAKEPANRFQSAAEVVEELGQHLAQLQQAAWVPPPRSPAPLGTNAGLPTSVTICPSCGASLNVPERMVGSVVHCAECGKAFHVEDGSEVIQVVQAVKPPLGPGFRPRRRLPGCVWFAAAGGAFLFLLIVWVLLRSSRESDYRAPMSATTMTAKPVAARGLISWKDELNGLPAEATLFGAINLDASEFLSLDDARIQALLRLFLRAETAAKLTPENLGRVRIQGVALGFYEGAKSEPPRAIVHVKGVALDGHKRIAESIRRIAGEKVEVEELNVAQGLNGPVRISAPDFDFALKIVNDNHAYLASAMKRDAKGSDHRKLLDRIPATTGISSGYNPPWVALALQNVPSDAYGFFLGEIPDELRKVLCEALGLRVCPRSFVCHLTREGQGVALSLTLNLDKPATDWILRDDLEKWRGQGIDVLRAKWPALSKEPKALELLEQTLKNMRWVADRGCTRTQVHVSAETWKALCAVLKQASR